MKTEIIAVTSRSFSKHPILREELLAQYPNVVFNDEGEILTGDVLVSFLSGCEKAIIALECIDGVILDQLPDLRVISKYGVGLDTLDLQAMVERDVFLGWTGGTNARSVAELALSFMISLLHRVQEAVRDVEKGRWRQIRGRQLSGKTVGVIGCGHVGKEVVRLLRPFDCRLLVHDIRDYPDFYASFNVEAVGLNELLMQSDVVTVHLPLDDSTRGMLDVVRIGKMKPNVVLVNTARGGIVDEFAVLDRLRKGHLGGVAFDVLAEEPPNNMNDVLLGNIMLTPHIGGSTEDAVLAMGRAAIAGLEVARPVLSYSDLVGHSKR